MTSGPLPPSHDSSLLSLTPDQLAALLNDLGQPGYRAEQLWRWLHQKRVSQLEETTNLPKGLHARLAAHHMVRVLQEKTHLVSGDELTEKWLFAAQPRGQGDTEASVETVLIREKRLSRRTVCISCMAGCPLGCAFCATGQVGFDRNLTTGEMVEQVYRVDVSCRKTEDLDSPRAVSHVVFMGMGEPLLNYDAVLAAAKALAHPEGMDLSGRHITISTVGVPEGIRRLAGDNTNFRLALSLHAPDQTLREKLIPAARQWPLPDVLDALILFAEGASRDITIEYCLISGMNDSPSQARDLARLLAGLRCKVNLIPLNPTDGFEGSPPSPPHVRRFQDALEEQGLRVTLRTEKGQDIDAACGQLRARNSGGK